MADVLYQSKHIGAQNIPEVDLTASKVAVSSVEEISQSARNEAHVLQQQSEKLYVSEFEANTRKAIQDISERNQSDPAQLQKELKESYAGFSKNAPSHLRGELGMQFDIMANPHINRAVAMRGDIVNDKLKVTSYTNMDLAGKELAWNAKGLLSDNDKTRADSALAVQQNMLSLQNAANTTDDQGRALVDPRTQAHEVSKGIEIVGQQAIMGAFEAAKTPEAKQAVLSKLLNNEFKIILPGAEGQPGTEIEVAKSLKVGTFERIVGQMESELKREMVVNKDEMLMQSYGEIYNSSSEELAIDTSNPEQMKGMNLYFENEFAPGLKDFNPAGQKEMLVDFVKRNGAIPKAMASGIMVGLHSNDPNKNIQAADLISGIMSASPQSLHAIESKSDVKFGLKLSSLMRSGMDPRAAVELARKSLDPQNKESIEHRNGLWRDVEIDAAKDIGAAWKKEGLIFDTQAMLSDQPALASEIKQTYINMVQKLFVSGSELKDAKSQALATLNNKYGVTEINGKRTVTAYPPERYYAIPGVDNQWMADAAFASYKKFSVDQDVKREDILLYPDKTTATQVNNRERPSYVLMKKDKSGQIVPLVNDKGNMVRMKFDPDPVIKAHNANVKTALGQPVSEKDFLAARRKAEELKKLQDSRLWDVY